MKFQVILTCVMVSMISSSAAAPTEGETSAEGTNLEQGTNASSSNHSYSEETIPILVVVDYDQDVNIQKSSDADLTVRDMRWMVIRKTTNISRIEEVFADDAHDKTRRVVVEDRAEEYKVFRDDQHHQVLDETVMKSIPLSFL